MKCSFESLFGVKLKDGVAARIEDTSKFLSTSIWFYTTPHCRSTVFHRLGFHVKCWSFVGIGVLAFFIEYYLNVNSGEAVAAKGAEKNASLLNVATRLITFLLSGYLIMIVKVYYIGARKKARDMIYGCSKAVDTITVTLDYDHPSAETLLGYLHGSFEAIGLYALAKASSKSQFKLTKDQMIHLFTDRGLNGDYFVSLPPKQSGHILRLAILQSIPKERNGCFSSMSDEDWTALRRDLNDYCGGASQTISSLSSSKLPFAYFHLINWSTHAIVLFQQLAHHMVYAEAWYNTLSANPNADKVDFWLNFAFVTSFQLVMVYFIFGCLEVFDATTHVWDSGLVLKNYVGIIKLVCEPLRDSSRRPKDLSELQVKGGGK